MIYLFGSELPETHSISFSLTSVYGIGIKTSLFVCMKMGFSTNFKTNLLSKDQVHYLTNVVSKLQLTLSIDLKKLKSLNLKRLISIKSYRGLRKFRGLPVRGQRTHTNAKNARKK